MTLYFKNIELFAPAAMIIVIGIVVVAMAVKIGVKIVLRQEEVLHKVLVEERVIGIGLIGNQGHSGNLGSATKSK